MGSLTIQAIAPLGPPVVCGLIGNPEYGRRIGTSASASSGGGGWQTVDRALTAASTEWFDYYPLVMSLTLMLTGGVGLNAQSVEPQIAILEAFELPAPGSPTPTATPDRHRWPGAPHRQGLDLQQPDVRRRRDRGDPQRCSATDSTEAHHRADGVSPSTTTVAGLTPAQQAAATQQTS